MDIDKIRKINFIPDNAYPNKCPSGVPLDMALGTDISSTVDYHTHISVIAVSTTGTVHISERE